MLITEISRDLGAPLTTSSERMMRSNSFAIRPISRNSSTSNTFPILSGKKHQQLAAIGQNDNVLRVMRSIQESVWRTHSERGQPVVYVTTHMHFDFGVMAARSSLKSIFQSALLTTEVAAFSGGCRGTYTGTPPLNVVLAMYWSKNGSNMMTSSPGCKNAVSNA